MNGNKQTFIVLSASSYSFKSKDGQQIEGLEISWVPESDLSPKEDQMALERGEINLGTEPAKDRLLYSLKSKIKVCPGLYEATLVMKSKKGEVKTVPVDLDFVSAIGMSKEKPAASAKTA